MQLPKMLKTNKKIEHVAAKPAKYKQTKRNSDKFLGKKYNVI